MRCHVQVALHVGDSDEAGGLDFRRVILRLGFFGFGRLIEMLQGPVKFAMVLPHFRRHPGHAHECVKLLLGFAADAAFLAPSRLEDAPFTDFQALFDGHFAELDVVLLAAGEILDGGAKRLRRHNPHIHLNAVSGAKARLALAKLNDAAAHRVLGDRLADGLALGKGRGDSNVDVADGFLAAAQAAAVLHLLHAREGAE